MNRSKAPEHHVEASRVARVQFVLREVGVEDYGNPEHVAQLSGGGESNIRLP